MRFEENGPNIPDELLLARDEGRVMFFCGAGVSRAKAGLPDFYGLADAVLNDLSVANDHATRKVLNEAREISGRTGVSGLISADRIFSLLEREFVSCDIESAVAKALKPKISPADKPVFEIMILVDTSIWIDHLRSHDTWLANLLTQMYSAIPLLEAN